MVETTMQFLVDFRERPVSQRLEETVAGKALGELLYWVLFGEGRVEEVQA